MNQPLLLFPNVFSGEAVEALKNVTDTLQESDILDFGVSQDEHMSTSTSFLQSLHHVATKIHTDLKATPRHSGYDNLSRDVYQTAYVPW